MNPRATTRLKWLTKLDLHSPLSSWPSRCSATHFGEFFLLILNIVSKGTSASFMCGIGGMLGEPDTAVLHRMNQLQQHRGPDDQGVWSDGQLGFFPARLAIVDVVSSQQLMHGLQGAVLVVNGEIYNHKNRSRYPSYPYTTTAIANDLAFMHRPRAINGPINRQRARCMDRSAGWHVRLCSLGRPSCNCFSRTPWASNPGATKLGNDLLFARKPKLRADDRYTPALDELALPPDWFGSTC